MVYVSTRGNFEAVKSIEAIRLGMVPNGGLFVPAQIPKLNLSELLNMDYRSLAIHILSKFLPEYTEEELKGIVLEGYSSFYDPQVVPVRHFEGEKFAVLELWYGPTGAFKDIALQIMPRLLVKAKEKQDIKLETIILVATSGDTGKAALEGFKNVPTTKIFTLFPYNGVSKIQQLQMITTDGENTFVIGINGNFDDCQTTVKDIFADKEYNEYLRRNNKELSSANSINWGRLVPQIVYYVWGYLQMVKKGKIKLGEEINILVPTGNFGNILASFYASLMGVPVHKFICASNINKVLADFFNTGIYDANRVFFKTESPSMDILISSNLERLLYHITDGDSGKVVIWYEELRKNRRFSIDGETFKKIREKFYGEFADDEETYEAIGYVYDEYGYLIDPHTAVGFKVYEKYLKKTGDNTPTLIASTASPYKFPRAVYWAITKKKENIDDLTALYKLNQITQIPIHPSVKDIEKRPIIHKDVINPQEVREYILKKLFPRSN